MLAVFGGWFTPSLKAQTPQAPGKSLPTPQAPAKSLPGVPGVPSAADFAPKLGESDPQKIQRHDRNIQNIDTRIRARGISYVRSN